MLWQTKKLGDLVDEGLVQLTRGKVISKKDISTHPGTYPIYSSAKDNDGMFGRYGKFLFDEPLITWSVDGGGRLFYRPKHKFSVTNIGGILRILKPKLLDYKYLYYVLSLKHSEIRFDWVRKAHPSIIRELYKGIPMLSLSKQKSIVKKLDSAFDKVKAGKENAEKNLQNSKELFESYLQSVFTNLGKDWEEKKIKEIGVTQTGITPKTANKKYYGNFVPFITPADVDISGDGSVRYDNKGLSEEGLEVGRKIEKDSVLMVCIGATIGKVGFSTQVVSCNQQINTLTPFDGYDAKLFYYILSTKSFFNKVIKASSQATLPIINKGKWENLSVSFPKSISEQKAIVKKLDTLSVETKKLEKIYEQKLADFDELKKSVLSKAFHAEL